MTVTQASDPDMGAPSERTARLEQTEQRLRGMQALRDIAETVSRPGPPVLPDRQSLIDACSAAEAGCGEAEPWD